jgi:hypothetical protein
LDVDGLAARWSGRCGFAPGGGWFGGVGEDFSDGFASAGDDETLAVFDFGHTAGEVLIGFAEGDLSHGGPPLGSYECWLG